MAGALIHRGQVILMCLVMNTYRNLSDLIFSEDENLDFSLIFLFFDMKREDKLHIRDP